jgi:metal-responsive CopG/Arc/MetJ family transcriptional regulator
MPSKKRCTFSIEPELLERLRDLKARTGIPESELVRQALRSWLDAREWPERAEKRRDVPQTSRH